MTPEAPPRTTLPRLSWAQFLGVLAFAVTHFLVGQGPVWSDPTNYRGLLAAIGWSYVPIPFLVAAALGWSRRWSPAAFLVSTVEVASAKFGVTASVMLLVWSCVPQGAPEPALTFRRTARPQRLAPAVTSPPPSVLDPAQLATLDILVLDAAGVGQVGVLAWIAEGLEDLRFAVPAEPLTIVNDGGGFRGEPFAWRTLQPLRVASADGRLHSLRAWDGQGRMRLNVPALPSRVAGTRVVHEASGLLSASCGVHPHEAATPARLLVLAHPYWGLTGEGGRLRLTGVPAERALLIAAAGGADSPRRPCRLTARGQAQVVLQLAAAGAPAD